VQTIAWGHLAGEVRVLPDPCGGDALYRFEVYLTWVGTRNGSVLEGFLVIEKKIDFPLKINTRYLMKKCGYLELNEINM